MPLKLPPIVFIKNENIDDVTVFFENIYSLFHACALEELGHGI